MREHAERLRLRVASKPDSQEICFVPDGDYAKFIEKAAPELKRPGTLLNAAGDVLGTHQGVHRFTIGQRKGLGLSAKEPVGRLGDSGPTLQKSSLDRVRRSVGQHLPRRT